MRRFIRLLSVVLASLCVTSCNIFISQEDAPESASHGRVSGVTPSSSESFANRTYPTIQANWPGAGGDKVWLGRNLGALDSPRNSVDDRASISGWYFQFNRKQGFYHTGEQLFPAWAHSSIDENSNWESSNDPCQLLLGSRWRLPSVNELRNFLHAAEQAGGLNEGNRTTAFNSALRLHAAGELHSYDGSLSGRGDHGRYWARDQYNDDRGESLTFGADGSSTFASTKAFGRPVRCIFD